MSGVCVCVFPFCIVRGDWLVGVVQGWSLGGPVCSSVIGAGVGVRVCGWVRLCLLFVRCSHVPIRGFIEQVDAALYY